MCLYCIMAAHSCVVCSVLGCLKRTTRTQVTNRETTDERGDEETRRRGDEETRKGFELGPFYARPRAADAKSTLLQSERQ